MKQAPIDELQKQCASIYKLVVIAAKRAKELSEGAPKLVRSDLKKVTSIALEEIHQGKVLCKPAEAEEEGRKGERKTKERAVRKEPATAKAGHAAAVGAKKKKA